MKAVQGHKSFGDMILKGLYFLHAKNIWLQEFKIIKKGFFCNGTKTVYVPGNNFHNFNFDEM
jgi:hypothetical protein